MTSFEIEQAAINYAKRRELEADNNQINKPKSERKDIDFAAVKNDFAAGIKYVLNLINN